MFRTVFVADPSRVNAWAVLPFLFGAAFLYLGASWAERRGPARVLGASRPRVLRVAATAALLGALVAAATTWAEYGVCSTPLEGKDVSVITGPVTDFTPMPARGHASEQFAVDGVRFAFSGIGESCSFNHAAVFGGPLREGLLVRVYSKRGRILRLDVAE